MKTKLWDIQSTQAPRALSSGTGATSPQVYIVNRRSSLDGAESFIDMGSPSPILPFPTATTLGVDVPFYWFTTTAGEHTPQAEIKRRKWLYSVIAGIDFMLHPALTFLTAAPDTSPLFFSGGDSNDLVPGDRRARVRKAQLQAASLAQYGVMGIPTEFINGSVYSADSCDLLSEIQRHMLEPIIDGGVTWTLWTQAEVLGFLNMRIQRFMIETGLIRKIASVTAGPGDLTYPSDLMEARRVAFSNTTDTLAELTNTAAAFWKLEEPTATPRFASIGTNTLTPNNATPRELGKIGNAAGYSRISFQSLSITDGAQVGLNPGLSDWSISTWIYPINIDAFLSDVYYFVGKGANSNFSPEQTGYNLGLTGGGWPFPNRIQFLFGAPPATNIGGYVVWNQVIPNNVWTHVVATFDRDGDMKCYINGVQVTAISDGFAATNHYGDNSGNCTTAAPFALGSITLASPPSVLSQTFDGVQDATGIWPFVLTQEQVDLLYAGGEGVELPASNFVVTASSALERLEQIRADNAYIDWASTTDVPVAYIEEPKTSLNFQLVPPPSSPGEVEVTYVPLPDAISGACVPLPFPNVYAQFIKWGVIADMLNKEGEANDTVRAEAAEARFKEGVELGKLLLGTKR